MNTQASAVLAASVRAFCGDAVPGCVFLVTRNGQPYADGSFGWARMPGAPDGPLAMSTSTLVHTGSVGKLICAVAVVKLIQVWNSIIEHSMKLQPLSGPARWRPRPGFVVAPEDLALQQQAYHHGAKISLDTKAYPLLENSLDTSLIAGYRARPTNNSYPGAHVRDITIRQLLDHTSSVSGLKPNGSYRDDFLDADLGGRTRSQVVLEPSDDSACVYDLKTVTTALLRLDTPGDSQIRYSNSAYTVLGALIESATGRPYTEWARSKLFAEARFDDIRRNALPAARRARYYWKPSPGASSFQVGNLHPDYTQFSASGGWYMSASAFCDWFECIMQKSPINGLVVLDHPEDLVTGVFGNSAGLGLDSSLNAGRLRGATKNGRALPGNGHTNAAFACFRGVGDERVTAFVQANAGIDATPLLQAGLAALKPYLSGRPGSIPVPNPSGTSGLLQSIYWDEGVNPNDVVHRTRQWAGSVPLQSAAKVAMAAVAAGVSASGAVADRTNLFGNDQLAGGASARSPDMVGVAELRGMLEIPATGRYRFRLTSEDGSTLWLDDELVIDNDGAPVLAAFPSAPLQLTAGRCAIRVQWYNAGGPGALFLEWMVPGSGTFQPVPPQLLAPL